MMQDDEEIKLNRKNKKGPSRAAPPSYIPFQTVAPSIGNPYLCQMCGDDEHCMAHVTTPINLGKTQRFGDGAGFFEDDKHKDYEKGATDDPEVGASVGPIGRSSFLVSGICCSTEVPAVRKVLKPLSGVLKVAINVPIRMVYVDHYYDVISAQTLADALNHERFGATIVKDAYIEENRTEDDSEKVIISLDSQGEHYNFLVQILIDYIFGIGTAKADDTGKNGWAMHPLVGVCGMFWLLSMLSFDPSFKSFEYFALISVIIGVPPIVVKSFYTLRRGQLDAQCNMLFAVIGALILGEYTEAAAVTFIFSLSDFLEHIATSRARLALQEIVSLRPEYANLMNAETKEITIIKASQIRVGDLLSVRSGDKVASDGMIVEGNSLLDESSLTGESRPVKKLTNDKVSGGTINVGASPIVVKATSTVENSAIARLIQLVEEAQTNQSPTEQLVDAFAKRITPVIVGVALFLVTIPWIFGFDIGREWAYNGIVLVVIACPCALVISTPITYVAGLAATAKRGIVIKGGSHLEALGRVKKVAFDKTGTLTKGNFELLNFGLVGNFHSYTEVMELLAALQASSSHPLANALIMASKSEGIKSTSHVKVENHTLVKGEGVTATVNNMEMYVGNKKMIERFQHYNNLPLVAKKTVIEWSNLGGTVGFVGFKESGVVGIYCVADNIRPEAAFVVNTLHYLDTEVFLLSGDDEGAALAVARQVGIPDQNVRANLLPKDKMKFLDTIMEPDAVNNSAVFRLSGGRTLVLFCGDGVNDAPALATANVGVSIGSGAAVAMESSNITLMDSNLEKLLLSIDMGKKVNRTIKENIVFSIIAKLVVAFFTFSGNASLWGAIAADVGSMLIVTVNGMKLLPKEDTVNDLKNDGDLEDDLDDLEKIKPKNGEMFVELPVISPRIIM